LSSLETSENAFKTHRSSSGPTARCTFTATASGVETPEQFHGQASRGHVQCVLLASRGAAGPPDRGNNPRLQAMAGFQGFPPFQRCSKMLLRQVSVARKPGNTGTNAMSGGGSSYNFVLVATLSTMSIRTFLGSLSDVGRAQRTTSGGEDRTWAVRAVSGYATGGWLVWQQRQ
jgi:hypothetical protein